jgi:hypothetical protein
VNTGAIHEAGAPDAAGALGQERGVRREREFGESGAIDGVARSMKVARSTRVTEVACNRS